MSASPELTPPSPEILLLQRWLRARTAYAQACGEGEAFSMTTWQAKHLADLIDAAWTDKAGLLRALLDQAINAEKAARSVEAESGQRLFHHNNACQVRDA